MTGRHLSAGNTHLEIAKLGELLATVVELAGEWLDLLMDNLVCAYVAALSKCLSADVTAVWALASMPSLVRLLVSVWLQGARAGGNIP